MDDKDEMSEQNIDIDDGDEHDIQGTRPGSMPVPRTISMRAWIIGGLSTILVLLLAISAISRTVSARINNAAAMVDEETERVQAALEVGEASANLVTALALGTVTRDSVHFAQTVQDAKQNLLDAEGHLIRSIASLPQDDPVQVTLLELEGHTADLHGAADRLVTAAEAGEWQQVEHIAQSTLFARHDQIVEVVKQMQELMIERQVEAQTTAAAGQRTIAVSTMGLSLLMAIAILGTIAVTLRVLARPVESLAKAAGRLAAGNLEERVEPGRVKEFAYLANAFNEMASRLQISYAQLEQQVVELKRETTERERLQQEIIEGQKQAILELSTPIIPVMDRILVIPLVGNVDSARANDITRTLLAGIRDHQARVVIVDITGVSVVDNSVAGHLNKTIQAARLKGARAIVTGISDAVAETIVELGIDWSGIETLRDLQSGLTAALSSLGMALTPLELE